MKLGALLMPSHPPERSIRDGQRWDLADLERLDSLGFEEAWIGEHFSASWEPCPAPDLLIAQALMRTERIRLGPLSHLLPFHNPVELAHRIAYLDHMSEGRYQLGVGIGVLPTDHQLFGLDASDGRNRRMTFEAIDMMTRLWTDGSSDFEGEFWSMGETHSDLPGLGYHLDPYHKPHPPSRVGAFANILYANLSPGSEKGPLGIELEFNYFSAGFGGYYRLGPYNLDSAAEGDGPQLVVDPYAGARYTYLDVELDLNLTGATSEDDGQWIDPIVGVRTIWQLTPRWSFGAYGDVGGFGVGSDFSWLANGLVGYRFGLFGENDSKFLFGYRALYQDYSSGSGANKFEWDGMLHGPLFALAIEF